MLFEGNDFLMVSYLRSFYEPMFGVKLDQPLHTKLLHRKIKVHFWVTLTDGFLGDEFHFSIVPKIGQITFNSKSTHFYSELFFVI